MDLVEEEDGAFAGVSQDAVCVVDDLSDSFDADGGGVLTDEASCGCFGDDFGKGGFAGPGWAVEDDGGEGVGVDHAPEEFALGEEVLLSDDLVDGSRANASRERFDGFDRGVAVRFPEVVHTGIVRVAESEKTVECGGKSVICQFILNRGDH